MVGENQNYYGGEVAVCVLGHSRPMKCSKIIDKTVVQYHVHSNSECGDVFMRREKEADPDMHDEVRAKLSVLLPLDITSELECNALEYFANSSMVMGDYFKPNQFVNPITIPGDPTYCKAVVDPFAGPGGVVTDLYIHISRQLKLYGNSRDVLENEVSSGCNGTEAGRFAGINIILIDDCSEFGGLFQGGSSSWLLELPAATEY